MDKWPGQGMTGGNARKDTRATFARANVEPDKG
jgi:hypothetical protein